MRVLRNLLDNALRYTPAGGRVRVAAALAARTQTPAIHVSVEDTGPGLPEGDAERVFERFYRSARARTRAAPTAAISGAGLGLTIARGLVQAHGGRMWAENVPGAGAAFHFLLPLSLAARTPQNGAALVD
jgi:signal transduction histidine kinase